MTGNGLYQLSMLMTGGWFIIVIVTLPSQCFPISFRQGATSSTMQPVIGAFNAELLELRAALRQSKELLQQRCELLHLQKFSGRLGNLGNGDVFEQHLQQCQEELARLEADDLETACQEISLHLIR